MKGKKVCVLLSCVILCVVVFTYSYRGAAGYVEKMSSVRTVVLDAGHGGIDGGAESSSGTCEKDINLAIAVFLKELLEAEDIKIVMTREEDVGLYDESQEGAIRTLKTQDMKERKRIIDEAAADLTVSIHLNSYTQDSSVKGAQVFYPSEGDESIVEESKKAAQVIQSYLNSDINTDKKRDEMGKCDVYLLRNVTAPIVIVECGFLSNPEDAENLEDEKYQKRIAETLKASICNYLDEAGDRGK